MNEQDRTNKITDDVEGHRRSMYRGADAESAEGDVEGHRVSQHGADAESTEGDDVEGHTFRR